MVEELKQELPQLVRFSTLSPVPGFRRWLERRLAADDGLLPEAELAARGTERWWEDRARAEALREPLTRLCAPFLTTVTERGPLDPVARFHLGNGARLERINWLGNTAPRGIQESYGIMVNYLYDLYDPAQIEANHERFVRGSIVRSPAVDALLAGPGRNRRRSHMPRDFAS